MKALITGATGLIGRQLAAALPGSVVTSRDPARAARELGSVQAHRWTPEDGQLAEEAFDGVDVVFHLAGEPVAGGRWTAERKRRIRDSRILGTRKLIEQLARLQRRPEVLVVASAVGYYGDRADEPLHEGSAAGSGFLAEVCADWEREALAAESLGMRVVRVRIGIVLAPDGGALAKMLPAFKYGFGGRLGSGKQWMPWVHLDDVVGIMLHAARNPGVRGAVNAVVPFPVTNADFTRALGRALQRPAYLPLPKAALRVALGEMSEVLTASQKVFPMAVERSGYAFRHPELAGALAAVMAAGAHTDAA